MRSVSYTLEYLLGVLMDQGYLNEEAVATLSKREAQLRSRVVREREGSWQASGRTQPYDPTPAEMVAVARQQTPDGYVLSEDSVMESLAMAAGAPYVKIDPLQLDNQLVTNTLSRPFAQRHIVLPLAKGDGRMRVALDNPFNIELIDSLRALSGCDIEVIVSSKQDILRCIRDIYGFNSSVEQAAGEIVGGTDISNLEQLMHLRTSEELEDNDAHIVNAVDFLLRYALEQRASDIHIEPKRSVARVRMRIDGVLHTLHTVPKVVHPAIVSRIKTLGRMDIAERRRPQDGRIKTSHHGREVELRLSTLPVAFGEKVVIRIFDPQILLQSIDGLGFFPRELSLFRGFIRRPNGILLVTGPTGSGKTTTLYSALRTLATPDVNIVTIEDPIEMVVEEFNQVAVHVKAGITFASALRTILRQDPDIIMVGEIRDAETAENAVQAALTGHLVLCTLHTNDAAGAITRLQDLGVAPFLIASTVAGVVAQRLVRMVCTKCRVESQLSREQCRTLQINVPEGRQTPELSVWRGQGCADCRQTGLRGRTGVFEIMPLTDRIRRQVYDRIDTVEINRTARSEGMMSLRECAIKKMAQGLIPFEEVVRVTSDISL